MYRLNREGVSVTKGILILVENFIILQITMTLMSILYLIIGYIFNIMPSGFILYITILGIIITIVSLFIAMFLCLKKQVLLKKVGYFFIDKFKFFKDKEDEKKRNGLLNVLNILLDIKNLLKIRNSLSNV
ncbi:MAG: hypothetical protein L6V81_02145 [Clostridium sp.]|nr:MAG: hypothetical protein L6V81_02145 [Clostridium sp.]